MSGRRPLAATFSLPVLMVVAFLLAGGDKWQLAPSLSDEFKGAVLDTRKWLPH